MPKTMQAGEKTESTLSEREKKALAKDALKHILPHFANNASLGEKSRIFTRAKGAMSIDIDGKRYLDSFASVLTTICSPSARGG
jgi:adenosylmethionine-8-amino-7-oxononanoate aminotransferase